MTARPTYGGLACAHWSRRQEAQLNGRAPARASLLLALVVTSAPAGCTGGTQDERGGCGDGTAAAPSGGGAGVFAEGGTGTVGGAAGAPSAGTDATGTTGASGATALPAGGCGGAPANLLVVLDLSGSMTIELVEGDPSQGTRYTATREALVAALPESAGLRVGLVYYGHPADVPGCAEAKKGCCARDADNGGADVPIEVMDGAHRQAIVGFLDAHGGDALHQTPTGRALEGAYDILAASDLGGSRYVLLLTDGDENCGGDWAATSDAAALALLHHPPILTFVVGSPGSEVARKGLSDLAVAGETPRAPGCDGSDGNTCHYDLSASGGALAEELKRAIERIVGTLTPC